MKTWLTWTWTWTILCVLVIYFYLSLSLALAIEFSRNTKSWQHLQFCTTSNGITFTLVHHNKVTDVFILIIFKYKQYRNGNITYFFHNGKTRNIGKQIWTTKALHNNNHKAKCIISISTVNKFIWIKSSYLITNLIQVVRNQSRKLSIKYT